MPKYKRIVSLILSLSLITGIVQQPVSALNKSPSSPDEAVDYVQVVGADGSITEVPVLNDEETIELLNEQVEVEEYTAPLNNDYWETVYAETVGTIKMDDSAIGPYIQLEGNSSSSKLPLYKEISEDGYSFKTYYLYGFYKMRTINVSYSFSSPGGSTGHFNQYFYTTLPYIKDDNFVDSRFQIVDVISYKGREVPLPNTIFETRCMRHYSLEEAKNGGKVNVNGKDIIFDGAGNAWFQTPAYWGEYESSWSSYGFTYPLKSDSNKTNMIKDSIQTIFWGTNNTSNDAMYRILNENDPSGFLYSESLTNKYLIPRRVYSAITNGTNTAEMAYLTPMGFTTDSGPKASEGGFYSYNEMQIYPWINNKNGELYSGSTNKTIPFSNTLNQRWMNDNSGNYTLSKIKRNTELKSFTITEEEAAGLLEAFEAAKWDLSIYEKGNVPIISAGTYYYLDPENEEVKKLIGTTKTLEYYLRYHTNKDVATYTPTGGIKNLEGNYGFMDLLLKPAKNVTNFFIPDETGEYNGIYFFPGPIQNDALTVLSSVLPADKVEAYYQANWSAKALYLMQYISFIVPSTDPEEKLEEGFYGMSGNVAWANSSTTRYNALTIPRIETEKVEHTPVPTVQKDLVLSGTQEDNLLIDDYYKTALYKVNDDIPDNIFEDIVGMSKNDFKNKSSVIYKDNTKPQKDIVGNLENMTRDEFSKCFTKLDPSRDSVNPGEAYVLQSSVYMTANTEGFSDNIDKSKSYLTSYQDEIYLGYFAGHDTSSAPGIKVISPFFDNSCPDAFMFPVAINDINNLKNDRNGDALISNAPVTVKNMAELIAKSGNRITPMGTTENQRNAFENGDIKNFESYTPYGTKSAEGNIIVASDEKENNLKIYRTVIEVFDDSIMGADEKWNLSVFLRNTTQPKLESNVYNQNPSKYTDYIDTLLQTYIWAAKNITDDKLKDICLSIAQEIENKVYDGETSYEDKKDDISRIVKTCGQENLYKVLGDIDLSWMSESFNDNVNNKNDALTLSFSVTPTPTEKQTNLRVKYVTIYGKPTGSTEEWKEIFRTVDLEPFKQSDGKYVIDLPALGQEFNIAMDYVVCYGQQFDSLMDSDTYAALDAALKETYSKSSTGNLYMYGYIQSIGGADEARNKTTLDYLHGASSIDDPWVDTNVTTHLDGEGTWRTCTKPSDSAVTNWTEDYSEDTANRVLSGKYYNELMSAGGSRVKTKADGTKYIADTYVLGVDPIWSSNEDDTLNDNTVKPLPCDDANPEAHCADPETVYIKYQFSNGKDFDNKITDIYLIDREGNRIDTTEDCFAPGKITDIDINSSDPYFSEVENLADHSYSLVVRVKRNITGKEHKDIGSQCELTFVGNLFGTEYTETSPLTLSLAYGSSNIANDKNNISNPVYNNGNNLAKNGDYITYYVNGLLPIQDTEICGTFIFKHREEDGTLSTNDMNMLNNYKKGAVNWGPLDYIVSNLVIWPDQLYATEDQVWLPDGGEEDLVSFTCNVEAQYTSPDGSRPIINNEKLWTNFTIYRERRPKNSGSDYIPDGCVYRIDNMKLTINGPTVTVTGKFRAGRTYDNTDSESNLRSEGYALTYHKDNDYRFVARINGGNGVSEHSSIHEYPADQKIKLETVRTNNKDIAELPIVAEPPDDEPLCTTPHVRNDWSITFYWTECPTPKYYTCCSGDPKSCSTCCTGVGCHSWTGEKSYWETYKMSGYVRSTANGWKWEPIGSSIELRAGQKFQISIHSDYSNNRAQLPAPNPYGGCTWRSRSPGGNYTSAYRYIRVMIKNTANSQFWKRTSNIAGWHQELNSPEFTVPEDTKNLTITVKAETSPFWGVREKSNQQLCTNFSSSVNISSPLPIAEGNSKII